MAKVLAKESGLPIIVVSPEYPESKLVKFFKSFNTPVCILFDEIEKNFKTEYMLDFLDGVEKTTQKLVIMTCNDLGRVSQYMQDRCSRVRYLRRYSPNENISFLPMLVDDFDIKNKEEVIEFCKNNIKLLSMDNIVSFLSEVKMLEEEDISFQEIISIMNISTENNLINANSDTINTENIEQHSEDEDYADECDDEPEDEYNEICNAA